MKPKKTSHPYPYIWHWKPNALRTLDRKGQRCRIVCRGAMNTVMLEFEDGYRVTTSGNGLRRDKA
jgi:hypothetical protein